MTVCVIVIHDDIFARITRKTYIMKRQVTKRIWLQKMYMSNDRLSNSLVVVSISCMAGLSTEVISGRIEITVRSGESIKTGESSTEFLYRVSA